nr:PREDICTED: uncharacterized protein LOC109038085 [Bemisia tabaci]XP_018908566.1 PREDICTED: uncharacterized protein LOC109038085 [Bemisia tabaci]XP_018908567.1 PREDICTED: uncharacterized protein LOC109038085 [Bemisia tabaci]
MANIYSALITGASQGIGLEFVTQFLTNPSVNVQIIIATCRNPENATALQEVKKTSPKVHILKLDVTQFDTYEKVVSEVENIVGKKGLTLLINNAGYMPGIEALDGVTPDALITTITINSVAPVILTKAFRPLLKRSAQVNATKGDGLSMQRAAVFNISSFLGSIALNDKAMRWCYRESKAALNMSTQSLAIELEKDGILVESFHPGHVRTKMGGAHGAIDATTSVNGLIATFLKLKEKNKKGFYTWEGNVMPF